MDKIEIVAKHFKKVSVSALQGKRNCYQHVQVQSFQGRRTKLGPIYVPNQLAEASLF